MKKSAHDGTNIQKNRLYFMKFWYLKERRVNHEKSKNSRFRLDHCNEREAPEKTYHGQLAVICNAFNSCNTDYYI